MRKKREEENTKTADWNCNFRLMKTQKRKTENTKKTPLFSEKITLV